MLQRRGRYEYFGRIGDWRELQRKLKGPRDESWFPLRLALPEEVNDSPAEASCPLLL